jgi:hypothetical protein
MKSLDVTPYSFGRYGPVFACTFTVEESLFYHEDEDSKFL